MISYPLSFSAEIQSGPDTKNPWSVSASGNEASCAIPQEFGGNGGALSPEDFFLLALSNCYVATFKVFSGASLLKFDSINVQSKLILDKDTKNQPFAKACLMSIDLEGTPDMSRAEMILKKVARSGILLNSVKTEIAFEFNVNGEKIS